MSKKYYEHDGNYYRHKKNRKEKVSPSLKEPVLARKLSDTFGLAEDIIAGGVMVRAEGKHKVCIENYRHIIEYTQECVRVQTKNGRIHIEGDGLIVAYYREEEMCVAGNIQAIRYI